VEIIPYEMHLIFLVLLSLEEPRNVRACSYVVRTCVTHRYTAAKFRFTSLMNANYVAYEDTN